MWLIFFSSSSRVYQHRELSSLSPFSNETPMPPFSSWHHRPTRMPTCNHSILFLFSSSTKPIYLIKHPNPFSPKMENKTVWVLPWIPASSGSSGEFLHLLLVNPAYLLQFQVWAFFNLLNWSTTLVFLFLQHHHLRRRRDVAAVTSSPSSSPSRQQPGPSPMGNPHFAPCLWFLLSLPCLSVLFLAVTKLLMVSFSFSPDAKSNLEAAAGSWGEEQRTRSSALCSLR